MHGGAALLAATLKQSAGGQVESGAHAALLAALWADTAFLAGQGVMDYSLLVGVDRPGRVLVVGIIDFLRQARSHPPQLPHLQPLPFKVIGSQGLRLVADAKGMLTMASPKSGVRCALCAILQVFAWPEGRARARTNPDPF